MELTERYLIEVGRHLPPKNRADILAELRTLIEDKLDERTSGEGEPTEADLVAVLTEMGSPKKVATSFAGERYLVGPTHFPMMMMVLRIGAISLTVVLLLGLWRMLTTPFASIDDAINAGVNTVGDYLNSLLGFFGFVVLIFAVLEWLDVRVPTPDEHWDPRRLPPLTHAGKVGWFDMGLSIAVNVVLFACASYFYQHHGIPDSDLPNQVIPISLWVLIGLLGALLGQIVVDLLVLNRGVWQVSTRLARGALELAGAFFVYRLLVEVAIQLVPTLPDVNITRTTFGVVINWHPAAGQGSTSIYMTAIFAILVVMILVDNGIKLYRLLSGRAGFAPVAPSGKLTARQGR